MQHVVYSWIIFPVRIIWWLSMSCGFFPFCISYITILMNLCSCARNIWDWILESQKVCSITQRGLMVQTCLKSLFRHLIGNQRLTVRGEKAILDWLHSTQLICQVASVKIDFVFRFYLKMKFVYLSVPKPWCRVWWWLCSPLRPLPPLIFFFFLISSRSNILV